MANTVTLLCVWNKQRLCVCVCVCGWGGAPRDSSFFSSCLSSQWWYNDDTYIHLLCQTQCFQLCIVNTVVSDVCVCVYVRACMCACVHCVILYLIQVSVAPCLSISEDSGNYSSLIVVLPPLRGWTPLEACHLPRTGRTDTHTDTHTHTNIRPVEDWYLVHIRSCCVIFKPRVSS